jgi:Zn ribbon nucleic-acid-binding protein
MSITMPQKRIQVRQHILLDEFMPPNHPILVACAKCRQCATLRRFLVLRRDKVPTVRLAECGCLHCGHQWTVETGEDFFIRDTLWLRMPCHKNVLWTLNRPHLEFMEQFVAADLREERMPEMSSRRLSSALPRWLIAGKNRDDVVRCLKKLREKLESAKLA